MLWFRAEGETQMPLSPIAVLLDKHFDQIKMTVLYRKGGTWSMLEVDQLKNRLGIQVCMHPKYSEYLILRDHHTKEAILEILVGGRHFTATQITGSNSRELPFPSTFI